MRRNCLSLAKQRSMRLRSPVQCLVAGTRLLAAARRVHRLGAERVDLRHQLPAVMAFVGQDALGLEPGQQRWRLRDVVTLAASEDKSHRAALAIHRHVDLRAQTSWATPQSRVRCSPFPVAACACARTMLLPIIRYSLLRS